jgi:uncharacterized phiE125 gp8 family phage protein
MSLVPITLPTVEEILAFVTPEAFAAHARLDCAEPGDAGEDLLRKTMIITAYRGLDGRDGLLSRAILPQTWRLALDYFPRAIVPPLPDLLSVTSIKYLDRTGVEQTLAPADYTVFAGAPGRIVPANRMSWPSTDDFPEAVAITFRCGFASKEAVPETLKTAILLQAATFYESRESVFIGSYSAKPLPGVIDMLTPFRNWGF